MFSICSKRHPKRRQKLLLSRSKVAKSSIHGLFLSLEHGIVKYVFIALECIDAFLAHSADLWFGVIISRSPSIQAISCSSNQACGRNNPVENQVSWTRNVLRRHLLGQPSPTGFRKENTSTPTVALIGLPCDSS